jgi:hypothetical protein
MSRTSRLLGTVVGLIVLTTPVPSPGSAPVTTLNEQGFAGERILLPGNPDALLVAEPTAYKRTTRTGPLVFVADSEPLPSGEPNKIFKVRVYNEDVSESGGFNPTTAVSNDIPENGSLDRPAVGLGVLGNNLFVALKFAGDTSQFDIAIFNLATGAKIGEVQLGTPDRHIRPLAMAVDQGVGRIYVTGVRQTVDPKTKVVTEEDVLVALKQVTYTTSAAVTMDTVILPKGAVGSRRLAVDPSSHNIFIVNEGSKSVTRIKGPANQTAALNDAGRVIGLPGCVSQGASLDIPFGITFAPPDRSVYLTLKSAKVCKISDANSSAASLATGTVTDLGMNFRAPSATESGADISFQVDSGGSRVYVTGRGIWWKAVCDNTCSNEGRLDEPGTMTGGRLPLAVPGRYGRVYAAGWGLDGRPALVRFHFEDADPVLQLIHLSVEAGSLVGSPQSLAVDAQVVDHRSGDYSLTGRTEVNDDSHQMTAKCSTVLPPPHFPPSGNEPCDF